MEVLEWGSFVILHMINWELTSESAAILALITAPLAP